MMTDLLFAQAKVSAGIPVAAVERMIGRPVDRTALQMPRNPRRTFLMEPRDIIHLEAVDPAPWTLPKTRREQIQRIIRDTEQQHGVEIGSTQKDRRLKPVVAARNEAMWQVKRHFPELSTPSIGKIFGRDHSSVIHSLRCHEGVLSGVPYRKGRK